MVLLDEAVGRTWLIKAANMHLNWCFQNRAGKQLCPRRCVQVFGKMVITKALLGVSGRFPGTLLSLSAERVSGSVT